jgi:hypothetical protein
MESSMQNTDRLEEVVFVLSGSRSGSTLLRFLLDAHPELACPPETSLPRLCWGLAQTWSVIEGVPPPVLGGDMSLIPEPVIHAVRQGAGPVLRSHLGRQGKARFCEKTVFAAQYASFLRRVYPRARFLCLYRHPMDFIASGLEACPWGMTSDFGFDRYAAAEPGNFVAALGRCWADFTEQIMATEERFPAGCYRVRYEDLVTAPEDVAGSIFEFLGVAPAPGITGRCFSVDRASGPGDFKIWSTSRVTADSLGRGWTLPVRLLPASLRGRLNGLAAKLGYAVIDETWGLGEAPADLRACANGQPPAKPARTRLGAESHGPPLGTRLLGERVQASLGRLNDGFAGSWPTYSAETLLLAAVPSASVDGNAWWRVDLAAGTVTAGSGHCAYNVDWIVCGPAETWEGVLSGAMNLSVAFRRDELKSFFLGDVGRRSAGDIRRVAMLADLLGIARWEPGLQAAANQQAPSGGQKPQGLDASPKRLGEQAQDDDPPQMAAPGEGDQGPTLIAYQVGSDNFSLTPAPVRRAWLDQTTDRFANRCLPLLIANQSGWLLLSHHKVRATWDGRLGTDGIHLEFLEGSEPWPVTSHFGHGVLTWHIPWLFRTSPGWNLLVRGPANWPRDGIFPLEGMIESDWACATFTMNWLFTRPHSPVVVEPGDPIAMIVPQRRGDLESMTPLIREAIPSELHKNYTVWKESRSTFLHDQRAGVPAAVAQKWQRDYFRGRGTAGKTSEHQMKITLKPFQVDHGPGAVPP